MLFFFVLAGLSVGSCFPSGCSETDIHSLLNFTMDLLLNRTVDLSVACQDTDMAYSSGAIATM